MKNRPIGIFDSGIGGLTVAKSLIDKLPGESFIYFGDTAHVPYGSKSREELFKYARDIIAFLLAKDVKAIIVACNTHSSITLPSLEQDCPVPILGVVKPGARLAVRVSHKQCIGIIATQATVNSRAYSKNIAEMSPDARVFESACPLFVPMVESGKLNGEEVDRAIREYLDPLMDEGIDAVVLGCTHYPFLAPAISNFTGSDIQMVDPAQETIEELKRILSKNDILYNGSNTPKREFYVSGNDESFYKVGSLLLGDIIEKVKKVTID